jgi:hypothetical protein
MLQHVMTRANPDELKDDLQEYERVEELVERLFAARRRHPLVPGKESR